MIGGMFNFADRLQAAAMDHRQKRSQLIAANVANAETPGYRALAYDFEEQLASLAKVEGGLQLETSDPEHMKNAFTRADGKIDPDVYVVPTETVPEDGNTVDMDREMNLLQQNQTLYRGAVELLNRKVGMLKYAINGGR
jgi:flagellar basal-body rod protein FlgB